MGHPTLFRVESFDLRGLSFFAGRVGDRMRCWLGLGLLGLLSSVAVAQQTGGNGVPGATGGGGGGAPSGPAGGALSGSYPNPGLSSGAVVLPAPSGSQTIAQPAGSSLQLNNVVASPLNSVIYVSGVNGAGIGVASAAWSSATAYPACRAVSFSSANYLSVAANTNVTPGTNRAIWYPVPNGATPTQLDCAFYTAASLVVNHAGASLQLGAGTFVSNIGLVEPTVTRGGYPIVNIYGQGRAVTVLQLSARMEMVCHFSICPIPAHPMPSPALPGATLRSTPTLLRRR